MTTRIWNVIDPSEDGIWLAFQLNCMEEYKIIPHTARFTVGDRKEEKQKLRERTQRKKSVYKHWKYNMYAQYAYRSNTPKQGEQEELKRINANVSKYGNFRCKSTQYCLLFHFTARLSLTIWTTNAIQRFFVTVVVVPHLNVLSSQFIRSRIMTYLIRDSVYIRLIKWSLKTYKMPPFSFPRTHNGSYMSVCEYLVRENDFMSV